MNNKISCNLHPERRGSVDWDHPANQKVADSIFRQGTCLSCGPGTHLGVFEKQPINVFLTY